MKSSVTVMKPIKQRSKSAFTANMFQQTQQLNQVPAASRELRESYDFVGPLEFRKKLLTKYTKPIELKQKNTPVEPIQFNQTSTSKNMFRSTINRNTVLSNLHKEQQIEITKQARNLQKYKEYQQIWQRKKEAIRYQTKKKCPILMDTHVKSLYVHPNQDKIDVINDFIVHYWEMSLRNHHPILQRHIKGHTFEKIQKEKLLQLRQGTRKIQQSIPILPVQKINQMQNKELSVSGRNKIKKEAESVHESFNTTRYSTPNTARVAQEQVYKISYQGDKRWMGTQNL